MTPDDVRQIAAWLEAAGLNSLSLTTPETHLRITLGGAVAVHAAGAPSPPPVAAVPSVQARGTGVFLAAHPSSDAPLVQPGMAVRAGDIVALLKTGPLLHPVTAPSDGTIGTLLAKPGTRVGYGTPLMNFTPAKQESTR